MQGTFARLPRPAWSTWVPLLGLVVLAATWGSKPGTPVLVAVTPLLAGAVLAGVHHAELIARRVGEPFGSLVLAVAVTVIEVGLIVVLMIDAGSENASLARDTVFAAVMITCNGILGLCVFVGALRQGVSTFNAEGSATASSSPPSSSSRSTRSRDAATGEGQSPRSVQLGAGTERAIGRPRRS